MALSGIQLSAGIVVGSNTAVDAKYGPYADLATAKSEIGVSLRYLGLTVGIETSGTVEEYWWESGTADGDLVAKGGGGGGTWGSITGTLSDQTDLQSALDGKVDENTAITGATKTKITYDAKGLVTAGEDLAATDLPSAIDATKIADGSVTNAEFQYIGGLTSDAQTQLDGKQATITGAATTIDDADLTASRALVSDVSGKVAVSDVTSTELGYLDGVTSAIQTQVDAKTTKLITTNRQTASYTLVLGDADKLVEMNVATANNLTVPPNSSVAFATGTQILLAQYGAGQTTLVAGSGVTIRSNGAKLKLNVQYSGATLIKIGTDEWYLFGDIVA
jgi:hypothetical protein